MSKDGLLRLKYPTINCVFRREKNIYGESISEESLSGKTRKLVLSGFQKRTVDMFHGSPNSWGLGISTLAGI